MITQERVRELLEYDQDTGVFRWRRTVGKRLSGTVAGHQKHCPKDRYWMIMLDGKRYMAHRLAYLYIYGYIPKVVDHVDNDPLNNRIRNLRAATISQNNANTGKKATNSSGYKGVSLQKERWIASINKDGKRIYVGAFDTAEEAHKAYQLAAMKIFGEFAYDGTD